MNSRHSGLPGDTSGNDNNLGTLEGALNVSLLVALDLRMLAQCHVVTFCIPRSGC